MSFFLTIFVNRQYRFILLLYCYRYSIVVVVCVFWNQIFNFARNVSRFEWLNYTRGVSKYSLKSIFKSLEWSEGMFLVIFQKLPLDGLFFSCMVQRLSVNVFWEFWIFVKSKSKPISLIFSDIYKQSENIEKNV